MGIPVRAHGECQYCIGVETHEQQSAGISIGIGIDRWVDFFDHTFPYRNTGGLQVNTAEGLTAKKRGMFILTFLVFYLFSSFTLSRSTSGE
jgi:hypothetical protein